MACWHICLCTLYILENSAIRTAKVLLVVVDEVLVHVWMARAKVYLLAMDSGHLHMQTITAGMKFLAF